MDQTRARELFKEFIGEAIIAAPKLKELAMNLKIAEHCGFGIPIEVGTELRFEKHEEFLVFISNLGAYGYTLPYASKKMLILF